MFPYPIKPTPFWICEEVLEKRLVPTGCFRRCSQDRKQVKVQLRVTPNKCHACGLFEQAGSCFTVGARSNCRFMGNITLVPTRRSCGIIGNVSPIHQGLTHSRSLVALKSHQQQGFLQWENRPHEKKQPGPVCSPKRERLHLPG